MTMIVNEDGYRQIIEEDIRFLDTNVPADLKGNPCLEHIKMVLEKSINGFYPRRGRVKAIGNTPLDAFINAFEVLRYHDFACLAQDKTGEWHIKLEYIVPTQKEIEDYQIAIEGGML